MSPGLANTAPAPAGYPTVKTLVGAAETTLIAALGGFTGAVANFGGAVNAKDLAAAGVAAAVAAAYKLSAVLQTWKAAG